MAAELTQVMEVVEQRGMDHKEQEEVVVVIVVETKHYRGNFRHREESTFAHKNLAESTFVPNVRAPHVDTKEVEAAVGLLLPDAAFEYQESTQKVRQKLLRCR